MATSSVPNDFTPDTTIVSQDVDDNFQALVDDINNMVVHVDGSKSMTGELGLSGDPTADLSAAPKQYVLAQAESYGNAGRDAAIATMTAITDAIKGDMAWATDYSTASSGDRLVVFGQETQTWSAAYQVASTVSFGVTLNSALGLPIVIASAEVVDSTLGTTAFVATPFDKSGTGCQIQAVRLQYPTGAGDFTTDAFTGTIRINWICIGTKA